MDKLRRTRSYQPVLTDIRSIAPTGWFGAPQHANAEKGHRMVGDIAEAIAREAAGHLPSARRGAGRQRRIEAAQAGGLMARLLKQSQAKRLGLPGRTSLEPVSGEIGFPRELPDRGSPVPRPDDKPRGPHLHREFEECIYVLSGEGTTVCESGEIAIKPGDIVLIPPGEKHMTRNTGSVPLGPVVFLPVPDVSARTDEFPSF
jgi:mannose-6-phosphate isomerase-like protein (cupin superfamily)